MDKINKDLEENSKRMKEASEQTEARFAKLSQDLQAINRDLDSILNKPSPEESPGMAKYKKRKKYTGFDLILAVIDGSLADQKAKDYEELKKIEKGLENKTLTKAEAKERLTAITGEEYD